MQVSCLDRPVSPAFRPGQPLRSLLLCSWVCAGAALVLPGLAHAEKADRQLPLTIEADRQGSVDLARKVVVFSGRVVLVQGTLRISGDRMEVTELPQGQRSAITHGAADQPAEFREKRDGVDEFVEGRALSIEYDSREEAIRLVGKATVRRLRGQQLAEEVHGDTIVWNGSKEFFNVSPTAKTGDAGTGRIRAVLIPAPAVGDAPTAPRPTPPSARPPGPKP